MSDLFDVLWNNIASNQAPGLNEYEKSVFLTLAEKQLVKEYFNSRTDTAGGGFDGSIERQYDFSSLIVTRDMRNITELTENADKIDKRSLVFEFPETYFLLVNEILSDDVGQYSVIPIDFEEYQRLMLKPYSMPVKRGAWRLITGRKKLASGSATLEGETSTTKIVPTAEILGKFNGTVKYKVRYVSNLQPIILDDLTKYGEGLWIDNIKDMTPCDLPEECHEEIVERAVVLARITWQGGTTVQTRSKED